MRIGLLREEKMPADKRVVLTPEQCKILKKRYSDMCHIFWIYSYDFKELLKIVLLLCLDVMVLRMSLNTQSGLHTIKDLS